MEDAAIWKSVLFFGGDNYHLLHDELWSLHHDRYGKTNFQKHAEFDRRTIDGTVGQRKEEFFDHGYRGGINGKG